MLTKRNSDYINITCKSITVSLAKKLVILYSTQHRNKLKSNNALILLA